MGLSVLSGIKWDSESGLDGTLCECGGLSGTEDLCLLIRVSQVRDLYGLHSTPSSFANIFANELLSTINDKLVLNSMI